MTSFFMPIHLRSITRSLLRSIINLKPLHISWTPCLIYGQTLKMISQVEPFLCTDKQRTTEGGWRIEWPKCCVSINNNKDKDNSLKNYTQNIAHQASFQKFRQLKDLCVYIIIIICLLGLFGHLPILLSSHINLKKKKYLYAEHIHYWYNISIQFKFY